MLNLKKRMKCTFCPRSFATTAACAEHEQIEHINGIQHVSHLHAQLNMLRQQLKSKCNEMQMMRNRYIPDRFVVPICTLCYERRKGIIFSPCAHGICQDCHLKLQGDRRKKKCPWCRQVIVSTISIRNVSYTLDL